MDYVGAGTIEFIADGSAGLSADRIWFMEMNTRLQVEHPVTEAITGQDLVEWQLRVASGEPLPMTQDALSIDGWAMEARLYAEDPAKGFLPSVGRLELFALGTGCRIDTGVEQGAEISPYYDLMIAKVIAHGPTRDAARMALADTLAGSAVWPLRTNAGFLVKALAHPAFAAGNIDTGLIAREGEALMPPEQPSAPVLAAAAARLVKRDGPTGFRLNAPARTEARFLLDDAPVTVAVAAETGTAEDAVDATLVAEAGQVWRLSPWRVAGIATGGAADGAILSPMPGRIIAVSVAEGDTVAKGQKLLTLEAMKMEHSLVAPFDGVVAELNAEAGAQVQVEALLARIELSDK